MEPIKTKVLNLGGSKASVLPMAYCKQLGLEHKSPIVLTLVDDHIEIRKAEQ